MSKIPILFLTAFLASAEAYCGSDRFGNVRNEVPRTSFTQTTDRYQNIVIVTTRTGLAFLKSVTCSGFASSTVTFYDTANFLVTTATRAKIIHLEGELTDWSGGIAFSSAIMYSKEGLAPCFFGWDVSYGGGVTAE